jgi:hypothetical protein
MMLPLVYIKKSNEVETPILAEYAKKAHRAAVDDILLSIAALQKIANTSGRQTTSHPMPLPKSKFIRG